ncbi:MAG: hypothetical protein GXO86_04940 [Chlorobi bacterium]|nr:hypothetical protein [Chlorobiota bacterium]
MKNKFYRFALNFSIYVAVIMLVSVMIHYNLPQFINVRFVYILLFIYAVTLAGFYFFSKSLTEKISRFANVYMIGTFAKLIIYSAVIVVYAWFNRENAVSFIITFFIYYLLLTVYEVVVLMKNPR